MAKNKAIKLECYQNMANYKRPGFNQIWQSYPLPPYSSIIGMVHKVCGFTKENGGYRDMEISVQGTSVNSYYDFFTKYSFNENESSLSNNSFRGTGNAELIIDVNLIIHILPKDESLFNVIKNGLNNPLIYPSLGRYEDILRIDNVNIISLSESKKVELNNDVYFPLIYIEDIRGMNITGTNYKLNKEFYIDASIRKWKPKIDVKLVKKGHVLNFKNPVLVDNEGNGIFYA